MQTVFVHWSVHPGRLTWNLQITHLERKMIFQTSMIMVHVNLPGCSSVFVHWHVNGPNFQNSPILVMQLAFHLQKLLSIRTAAKLICNVILLSLLSLSRHLYFIFIFILIFTFIFIFIFIFIMMWFLNEVAPPTRIDCLFIASATTGSMISHTSRWPPTSADASSSNRTISFHSIAMLQATWCLIWCNTPKKRQEKRILQKVLLCAAKTGVTFIAFIYHLLPEPEVFTSFAPLVVCVFQLEKHYPRALIFFTTKTPVTISVAKRMASYCEMKKPCYLPFMMGSFELNGFVKVYVIFPWVACHPLSNPKNHSFFSKISSFGEVQYLKSN